MVSQSHQTGGAFLALLFRAFFEGLQGCCWPILPHLAGCRPQRHTACRRGWSQGELVPSRYPIFDRHPAKSSAQRRGLGLMAESFEHGGLERLRGSQ